MTRHSEFVMESRRYGSGYTNFVQIVCGWCNYEAWFPAKNGGWAMRIFRAHGWKVGSKPTQHRCPKCFGKAMSSRRIPDNPVISKELGKLLKTTIIQSHLKESLMSTASLHPRPQKPAQAPQGTADPTPPAEPPMAPEPAPAPAVALIASGRGYQSYPGVTVHPTQDAARAAGSKWTKGSVDGLGFFIFPAPPGGPQGWYWKLEADTTPEERVAWRASRQYGPKPHKRGPNSPLGPKPTITKEEPQMTANVTPIRKDPMPTTIPDRDPVVAAAAFQSTMRADALPLDRQPTRDQRAIIHDELTKVYDPVDQRYGGGDSDKVLGERLDLPWAWVRDVRTMFFGEFDRNSMTEKHKKELDAVIILASGAAKRLLEMATEAEGLEQSLIAARKKLGD